MEQAVEYVVFYNRDVDGVSRGTVPAAAISYLEEVTVVGDTSFVRQWDRFFASAGWKDRPAERKSLESVFARTMMPLKFVSKEEFDTAVERIKAAIPLGGAATAKRYAWRDDDVVVQKAPERKKK